MKFRVLIIAGIAGLSGCDDSALDPFEARLGGRYVLESINGNALPALERENEYNRTTVFADTLEFTDPGIARSGRFQVFDKTTGETTTYVARSTPRYRVLEYDRRGATIEFLCDDTSMCHCTFLGRIAPGGTMITGCEGEETYWYRRIR